ncbi:12975_t:CDS:2, partial [Funneliformis caledonium]
MDISNELNFPNKPTSDENKDSTEDISLDTTFSSREEAELFLEEYGRRNGFAIDKYQMTRNKSNQRGHLCVNLVVNSGQIKKTLLETKEILEPKNVSVYGT